MLENLAQSVQKGIQDLLAPDVRELKVLVAGLQQQLDQRFDAERQHTDQRFDAQKDQSDVQFKALMAALGEFKAQSELTNMRIIVALSERVAVLEARRQ